eukprot:3113161-Rhodomonas_salina.6
MLSQSPTLHKHREYLWGSRAPFSSFWCVLPDWKRVAFATVLSDPGPSGGPAVPASLGSSVGWVNGSLRLTRPGESDEPHTVGRGSVTPEPPDLGCIRSEIKDKKPHSWHKLY